MDRLVLDLSQVKAERVEEKPTPAARRIFTEAPEAPEVSFDDMLSASIRKVNSLQLEADDKVRRLVLNTGVWSMSSSATSLSASINAFLS